MSNFRVEALSDKKISITSDTYWTCDAVGNFKLSKYNGVGDSIIDVIIPDDIMMCDGTVYFSFGDDKCIYPEVNVHYNNECYVLTYPNYIINENGEKTITLYFNEERETFSILITCFGEWEVESENAEYIKSDRELMAISTNNNGKITIHCNCEKVYVNLIKNEQP